MKDLEEELGNRTGDARIWQARNTIMNRRAEIDPEGLMAYSRTTKDQQFKNRAFAAAFQSLAKVDLSKAIEGLEDISDRDQRQTALGAIINAGADDPEAMLELLARESA